MNETRDLDAGEKYRLVVGSAVRSSAVDDLTIRRKFVSLSRRRTTDDDFGWRRNAIETERLRFVSLYGIRSHCLRDGVVEGIHFPSNLNALTSWWREWQTNATTTPDEREALQWKAEIGSESKPSSAFHRTPPARVLWDQLSIVTKTEQTPIRDRSKGRLQKLREGTHLPR